MSLPKGRCGVISCENFHYSTTANPGINYFKVPSIDTNISKKWMIALKDALPKYRGSFVCSQHFSPSDILMKSINGKTYVKLKEDAVPKIMSANDDSAMNVNVESDEVIQYVDIEAIKNGSAIATSTNDSNGRVSPNPVIIIQPRLSTSAKSSVSETKIENTKRNAMACDLCKVNKLKLAQANGNCRRLEQINQNLKEQIKYLMEKIRMQEKTNEKNVVEVPNENPSQQIETTTIQSPNQSSNEDASNSIQDDSFVDLSVDCITPEEPTSNGNDLTKKAKKRKRRPTKNTPRPTNRLAIIPENSAFFKCGICVESVAFQTSIELGDHMKENHSKNVIREMPVQNPFHYISSKSTYQCYICKMKLNGWIYTKKHLKTHIAVQNKKCFVCGGMCSSKELDQHMCAPEKCIQCAYCTKSFRVTTKLIRHIDTEHETEIVLHRCGKCKKFFTMAQLRDLHEQQHTDGEKLHDCQICGKAFYNIDKLTIHLNRHSYKREHQCHECGKAFKGATDLKNHAQIHTGKTIKCPDCPLLFISHTRMNYHREIHMDKKFKCNLCNAVLGTRATLTKHIKNHQMTEADKKYECQFCKLKCANKDKLTVHIRKHTGEKPYVCEYCPDRKFAYKQDYRKHLQTHVGDNIYTCEREQCGMGFRLHKDFRKHTFEHYKQDKNKNGAQ